MAPNTQDNVRIGEREEPLTASTDIGATRSRPVGGSSRESLAGAGWICQEVGRFRGLVLSGSRPFSWLNPLPLWQSRNQVLANLFGDPTNDERRRWMEIQRKEKKLQPDLIIDYTNLGEELSFLVVGDTGEGDASQFAVVPPLLEVGRDTAFMVICSDVIYPSGDAEDYADKFYRPYKNYAGPIYALPGNHDWYDGLNGFMYHLCEAQERTLEPVRRGQFLHGRSACGGCCGGGQSRWTRRSRRISGSGARHSPSNRASAHPTLPSRPSCY